MQQLARNSWAFLSALSIGVVGGAAAIIALVEIQVGAGRSALGPPAASMAVPARAEAAGPGQPAAELPPVPEERTSSVLATHAATDAAAVPSSRATADPRRRPARPARASPRRSASGAEVTSGPRGYNFVDLDRQSH